MAAELNTTEAQAENDTEARAVSEAQSESDTEQRPRSPLAAGAAALGNPPKPRHRAKHNQKEKEIQHRREEHDQGDLHLNVGDR